MTRTRQSPADSSPPVKSPRVPLDRERIARAALALIDREGLDGCSMRRLGQELGVEAMTLYHHFKSKAELLDAVLELLASQIELPDRETFSPIERVRITTRSYRQQAVTHPRAFVLLSGRRFNTQRAFTTFEQVLTMYADCGFDAKEQAYWFRLIGGFANGAGMAYVASIEHNHEPSKLQLQHAPEAISLPRVSAAAPFLRIDGLDAAFEFGLDILLEALAQRAPALVKKPQRRNSRTAV